MMKIYSIEELKSSKILYDKNPPKFLFWILFSIFSFLIFIIILSCFTYKIEVVKSTAILMSNNKTSVQSKVSGKISEVYVNNGEMVSKGSVLFKIDDTETYAQMEVYKTKSEFLDDYIENYNTLIQFLNSFDIDEIKNCNPYTSGYFYYQYESVYKTIAASEVGERQSIIDQYIESYYQTIFQYQYEYLSNKSQEELYESILDSYKVYATSSGYVNYNTDIYSGLVVDQNVIGTISEKVTEDNAELESYVSVSCRNFIDIGEIVEMAVSGLSQSKYGTLKGKISYIGQDYVTIDNNIYYLVKIIPNSISMKENIILKNGQAVEVRIKYDDLTWFEGSMKKIGIIN